MYLKNDELRVKSKLLTRKFKLSDIEKIKVAKFEDQDICTVKIITASANILSIILIIKHLRRGMQHSIPLHFYDSFVNKLETIQCKSKKTFPILPIPTREGYKFMGWFLEENLENACEWEKMPKNDIVLYHFFN